VSDPNEDRERLAEEALGREPDKGEPGRAEPWAKTSSGDKEHLIENDEDDGDDLLDSPSLPGPDA